MSTDSHAKTIIGSIEYVEVAGVKDIPAKIDTGADSSAIWVSNINMEEDGTLSFSLFGQKSPFYTGKVLKTTDYKAKIIRSSHGDTQVRYRVILPLKLGGKSFDTTFTLANRSRNNFPILIGRRTIKGEFLVDTSKNTVERKQSPVASKLNQELEENPQKFHRKYIERKETK